MCQRQLRFRERMPQRQENRTAKAEVIQERSQMAQDGVGKGKSTSMHPVKLSQNFTDTGMPGEEEECIAG